MEPRAEGEEVDKRRQVCPQPTAQPTQPHVPPPPSIRCLSRSPSVGLCVVTTPARSRASAAMRTDRYLPSTCGEPTWASLRWVLFVAVSAHKWYWAAGAVFPRILPVLVPKFKEGNARGTRRSGPPVRPPWNRRIGTVLSLR